MAKLSEISVPVAVELTLTGAIVGPDDVLVLTIDDYTPELADRLRELLKRLGIAERTLVVAGATIAVVPKTPKDWEDVELPFEEVPS
jgi:hypothetical protein